MSGFNEPKLVFLLVATIALLGFAYGTPAAAAIARQLQLDSLAPGKKRSPIKLDGRLRQIQTLNAGNVVGYAGFEPFVGAGAPVSQWGSALRLLRRDDSPTGTPAAEREFATPPFDAIELKDAVTGRLRKLTGQEPTEQVIPGLTVQDKIFKAGTEMTGIRPFATGEEVAHIVRHPVDASRHFLVCTVESWHGELVTNLFVHLAMEGSTLYINVNVWVLPPCDDSFRIVDLQGGTGTGAHLKAITNALANAPKTICKAPANLIQALVDTIKSASARDTGSPQRGIDYGARLTD